jgi:Protein of unknown function (DUF2924)
MEDRFTKVPTMLSAIDQNTDLENDLAALPKTPIRELRDRWRGLFRTEPPAAFGPDLLRRSIAYRLQEQRFGGLSPAVQRQLNQIIRAMADKPGGRIELPRRIKAGAVLIRTWKDKSHRVTVLENGFAFEGRVYPSLSEIAREITGTRWNGPRFFGLRTAKAASVEVDEPAKRRGRPPGVRNGSAEVASGGAP